jgi:predicted ATP-dependent serine protease
MIYMKKNVKYECKKCENSVSCFNGKCYQCQGKGWMNQSDRMRTFKYFQHRRVNPVKLVSTETKEETIYENYFSD